PLPLRGFLRNRRLGIRGYVVRLRQGQPQHATQLVRQAERQRPFSPREPTQGGGLHPRTPCDFALRQPSSQQRKPDLFLQAESFFSHRSTPLLPASRRG